MMRFFLLIAVLAATHLVAGSASARSLESIRRSGSIGLCAHPNSLPFASKTGDLPGFQVELGRALAQQLGVSLQLDWILTSIQIRRADCDIVMDTIADREAQEDSGLRISKPYYRTGAALVVGPDSRLTSFQSLDDHTKVGVQVGSMAAMILSQRHVRISVFGFEEDALRAISEHEIDAATVTPAAAGYFNLTHPDQAVRLLGMDETEPNLTWNVAVGMLKPDDKLRGAIDDALDHLRTDGTIDRIYGRYGVILQAPK